MKHFIILILTFLQFSLSAQTVTISGFVTDAETGEQIINALVIEKGSSVSAVSNNFGWFSLKINKKDTIALIVSSIAYISTELKVSNFSEILHIKLTFDNQIEEITIIGEIPVEQRIEIGTLEIPINQLNNIPVIGAEADIMKVYQLMPGIQSGNEGSSGLYVRGGSPDENLILLDDVPLYYVNHLGGFVSVFNTDALKNVNLIKGGFPARYGGRLSSIMNVRMKEGNMNEHKGSIGIGMITSKLSLEGPILKDKSSYFFSARGFLWGFLFKPISRIITNASIGYDFYDLNAKINTKLSDKDRLFFSFYKGDDDVVVKFREKDANTNTNANSILRWGNTLLAARWNRLYNPNLFSNTILSYTKYRYGSLLDYSDKTESQEYKYEFNTGIDDITLKSDFEYSVNPNYDMRLGIKNIFHTFSPGFSYYMFDSEETKTDTSFGYENIRVFESSIYIENEFKIGKYVSGNIGINANLYYVDNKGLFSPEPRILLNFNIPKKASVKLAYTRMQQNVHLLTSNTVSLPMDIWVPSTIEMPPSHSQQYSAGFYKTMFNGKAELSIETYYKTSNNLITYKEGTSYRSVSKNWTDKLENGGKGTSYGAEFLLQKKHGKLTGWLAYTYAKTNRQFDELNSGKTFNFKYDRRHDISITASYKINTGIDISGTWVFGTGYPFTLPVGKYESVNTGTTNLNNNTVSDIWYNEIILTYADRNEYRMRTYHRLDFSVNLKKEKKNGIRTWSFNIYNTYNRQNPYYYYTKTINSELKLYQQSLFPIIPSVSYSYTFKYNTHRVKSKNNNKIINKILYY